MIQKTKNDSEHLIDAYLAFYDKISTYLKTTPKHKIDWTILTKHEIFVSTMNDANKNITNWQLENTQKELNLFIEQNFKLSLSKDISIMIYVAEKFNSRINIQNEIEAKSNSRDNIQAFLEIMIQSSAINTKKLKNTVKNTYELLTTMRICLDEYGLLMNKITTRSNYTLYNFEIGKKGETNFYCHIEKEQFDKCVNLFNEGQDMRVDGNFVKFDIENNVTITATKLKNIQEITRYKQRKHIYSDSDFVNDNICLNVTSQFISPQIFVNTSVKREKSIEDYVSEDNLKVAFNLLKSKQLSIENRKHVIILQARFTKLEKSHNKGITSLNEYNIEFAKIAKAVLDISSEEYD